MGKREFEAIDLTERNREVFQALVEMYLMNGSPVGSRTLSREIDSEVSSSTIRNAMQDLEYLGLLESPHISAGRIPTERGLRIFVDEYLEVHNLEEEERTRLDAIAGNDGNDVTAWLDRAGSVLSELTQSASLVLAPKVESPIRHIEFVSLAADRALVVLVTSDGRVENRIFRPPAGQTPSAMREAANFINAVAAGKNISELKNLMGAEIDARRAEIDEIATELIRKGLAVWDNESEDDGSARLIVRGRSNLLGPEDNVDMGRIRELFDDLERKRDIAEFLDFVEEGDGVKVFIGSENKLFSLTGSTLVISPYMTGDRKILGAVGVIGPKRLNYGRVVPIVDYTAQLVGKMVAGRQ
ncbi:MAG: heat-inducible transcriptional repressor HrcA [Rhodobacteraceae bacterium]|nr:heat-inducible transcriptional repressor HrcA [Paracoccaceae bacterium]